MHLQQEGIVSPLGRDGQSLIACLRINLPMSISRAVVHQTDDAVCVGQQGAIMSTQDGQTQIMTNDNGKVQYKTAKSGTL